VGGVSVQAREEGTREAGLRRGCDLLARDNGSFSFFRFFYAETFEKSGECSGESSSWMLVKKRGMQKDERLTGRRNMPCGRTILKESTIAITYSFSLFRFFYAETFKKSGV